MGDVRFTEEHLPTRTDGGKRTFFGVSGNHWRGFKIAHDTRGPVTDSSTMEREKKNCPPRVGPLMTKRVLGRLGAFWRRKVIEDAEQIAIWICRGKLVQTPRL